MRRLSFFLLALSLLAPAVGFAQDTRFSATLRAEDRTAAGLGRLDSDQIAILDALVRRDTATRGRTPAATSVAEAPPAEFSRRLSADERRNAGFERLSTAETAHLDGLIDRHQSAALARTFLAPPAFLTPARRADPTERKTARRVHGSFALSYGMGSGGYREKSGAVSVTIDDPERNLSVTVGYARSEIEGAPVYLYREPVSPLLPRRGPDLLDPAAP
jgi:hypothetical protein